MGTGNVLNIVAVTYYFEVKDRASTPMNWLKIIVTATIKTFPDSTFIGELQSSCSHQARQCGK